MPNNYVLLEKITVGAAGAASVTFANIPQTGYTDLVVKMSARDTASASNWYTLKLQFNSDTTDGNYSTRIVYGFGSTAGSGTGNRQNTGYITSDARTANTFNNLEMYIPNYAGSTNKSFSVDSVTEGNGSTVEILGMHAGLWNSTAAITQIVLAPDAGNFAANSTFYLYGVAKLGTTPAIAPKATGGDIVMTDGTYWYHAFRSSGTFTPAIDLIGDMLVVAGGGGGGAGGGGGGGAGGLLTFTSQSLVKSTNYSCTVGAGAAVNTNGNDSQFGALTLVKGGGLGGWDGVRAGQNGGSGGGGGASGTSATWRTGGSPTSGQGFAGGAAGTGGSFPSGGGGGAGGAGGSATGNTTGGAGGIGFFNALTNAMGAATGTGVFSSSNYYYAGGGGGAVYYNSTYSPGTGGLGGGGNGGSAISSVTAQNGTANTGGGGGGQPASLGGSGIVIIRYPVAS